MRPPRLIESLRLKRGWRTYREAAKHLRISHAHLHAIEHDQFEITVKMAVRLATGFRIMRGGEPDPRPFLGLS